MYHALAMMQQSSDLTLAVLKERLHQRFPMMNITQVADEIIMANANWDYHLALQSGDDVLRESEGLAGRIAGLDEDTPLRSCSRRLEVWSDTPDPVMEHFDDHFQVLDVLRSFKGVMLVDPNEPCLL